MHAWEIISGDGVNALNLVERETPIPGPGQVRVRMNANSINYRPRQSLAQLEMATCEHPLPRS
jgi:NADPH:quinone reductase-like Zn-dependent oxidoreductase